MSLWMLAASQAAAGTRATGGLGSLVTMIIIMVALWFIMIVPQRKQQKKRAEMLKSLKKGDKVITIGGLHGEITEIDDDEIKLRIADKTEVKFSRSSVGKIKG
ncbi:MAG TPA: preprotein translocase subunit YajC [Bacillota bacterium]